MCKLLILAQHIYDILAKAYIDPLSVCAVVIYLYMVF